MTTITTFMVTIPIATMPPAMKMDVVLIKWAWSKNFRAREDYIYLE